MGNEQNLRDWDGLGGDKRSGRRGWKEMDEMGKARKSLRIERRK